MIKERYVIDTNGFISFFSEIFQYSPRYDNSPVLSQSANAVIQQALSPMEGEVLLSVPSIVFIEIYEKWLKSEEFQKQFLYEIYFPLKQSPNIEIRAMDQELLENLLSVDGELEDHDLHDKIVVAAAITLECPIITSDRKIIRYVKNGDGVIPGVLN